MFGDVSPHACAAPWIKYIGRYSSSFCCLLIPPHMPPNPKCRLFSKIDLAALCLTDFIDWRYIHSWLVFSAQLVNCCPHGRRNYTCVLFLLYLLTDLPAPLPKLNVQYIQTVCGCGGWGVLNCAEDHILQEFYTLFLTRFRTYKIATPPQAKMTSKDDIKGMVSLKFLRPWNI